MVNCAVVGCSNNSARNNKVSYHKLPSEAVNPDLRQAWLQQIAREDPDRKQTFILRKNCYVCSDHFVEEDYKFSVKFLLTHLPNSRTNRILKEGTVPSKNLILKPKKRKGKASVRNADLEISAVMENGIKIEPFGKFTSDSANSADLCIDSNRWSKTEPRTEPGEENGESSEQPTISEEYGKIQCMASAGSWEKNPKRSKIYQNPAQFSKQVLENSGALNSDAGFDENVIENPNKITISDWSSFPGPDLVKPDRLKLEEPSGNYEPPLPICRISEDAGTQCEVGSESYENASKKCQTAPAENPPTKTPRIRVKKLSDLVGKPMEGLPRSNFQDDFIICVKDTGVQCEIGKELYKNVLQSPSIRS